MKRVVYKTTTHMAFDDLTCLNMPSVQPSNVISCTSSEYILMLNRSRAITAMHKALLCSPNQNSKHTDNVNMIDFLNTESIKYADQTNIEDVQCLFNKNKPRFMRARDFQENYVSTWNKYSSEVSMLLYLEIFYQWKR